MSDNQDLLAWRPPQPVAPEIAMQDGETIETPSDGARLSRQMLLVIDAMLPESVDDDCGRWFTVDELEDATGKNWASVGARLRDTHKPKFKCPWYAQHNSMGRGKFCYRLIRFGGPTYKAEISEKHRAKREGRKT